jgi:hypothetical protein
VSAPDLIAPVTAFRTWRLVGDHLSSPYMPVRWDRPQVRARCYPANRTLVFGVGWLDQPHDAPHPACRCGIYGYYAPPRRPRIPDPGRATGIVSLWGRIEAHRDGMRAEHARVEALAVCPEWGSAHHDQVRRIAGALGADVVDYDELPAAAGRYGESLPAALVP